MITKNSFYIGDFYIPQAKPSISMEALGNDNKFMVMLDRYEEDAMIECFGITMYRQFADTFDTTKDSLLKDNTDDQWDKLMNGHEYQKDGKTVYWNGLRYKFPMSSLEPNASLLTGWVYFHHSRWQHSDTTTTGEKQNKSANADNFTSTPKVVRAWNIFVKGVQGQPTTREVIEHHGLIGVDYYKGHTSSTMYKFITDMQSENDWYTDFKPGYFELMNEFGI